MNKSCKNFAMIIIVLIVIFNISSCSENNSIFEQENFQFNNVFTNGRSGNGFVFEEEDYIYFSVEEEDYKIRRIDKKTNNIQYLNIYGYKLNIYKNYLYYINHGDLSKERLYSLHRINLDKLNEEPELILEHLWLYDYFVVNDFIYFLPFYPPPIFSMNINDFSQTTEYDNLPEKYLIAGVDEKYRYIIRHKENVFTLARCLHEDTNFENREYLSEILHPEWGDYRFNDFLVIKNGFAYYSVPYDYHDILYKCELKAGAENEIVYESSHNERFDIIAVTDDGIYINKFQIGTGIPEYDDYILRLDFSGENETKLHYSPELLYFVSSEDGKLKYIKDKIHLVE